MRKILATLIIALMAGPVVAFANNPTQKFEQVDTNKDGVISQSESDAAHDEKFSEKDANGDGSVSKAEFDAYMNAKKEQKDENRTM